MQSAGVDSRFAGAGKRKKRFSAPALFFGLCLASCSPESASAPGGSTTAWFRDVAAAVGLEFVHEHGARGEYQLPEIMGSGCAWIDYDADGDLDAYLISAGAANRLFRNDARNDAGGRTFTDVTVRAGVGDTGYGMGCAVGDYDGDGYADLYVTNFGPNRLYRNRGDGTFAEVTELAGVGDARWGASAVFFDADQDGDLDLFVTNYMKHPEHSSRPCFDAAGRMEYCGPHRHFPPDRDTLYQNNGDGTFADVTREAGLHKTFGYGLGVVSADFNDDGHPDLYVANDATANQLWLGDGRGRFVDRGVEHGAAYNLHGQPEAGMGIQAEDVNGDGHLDLLVTHLVNETNTFYLGIGKGHFEDATHKTGLGAPSLARTGFGMGFLDADHDGDLDLFVTNGRIRRGPRVKPAESEKQPAPARNRGVPWDLYAERDQFFEHVEAAGAKNTAAGPWGLGFTVRDARTAFGGELAPHIGRGLALGDYDNDGDVDALVTACGGRVRLYENRAPKRGRWVIVRAVKSGGRGDVYGARITVTAGDNKWSRSVQPGYSYLSSNDPRVHFGVGAAERVDVTVRWPDGRTTEQKNIEVDQIVVLERE